MENDSAPATKGDILVMLDDIREMRGVFDRGPQRTPIDVGDNLRSTMLDLTRAVRDMTDEIHRHMSDVRDQERREYSAKAKKEMVWDMMDRLRRERAVERRLNRRMELFECGAVNHNDILRKEALL